MPRDHQAILDAAFAKLKAAGVVLDHRRRWQTPGLAPVEKVEVILNDLYCESVRSAGYWLDRGYCARGHVELQRVTAALVEAQYALDPVAAEVVLALCEWVELSPPSRDGAYAEEHDLDIGQEDRAEPSGSEAECAGLAVVTGCYGLLSERMLAFNEAIVDAWPENLDPFTLALAHEPPKARRRIAPLARAEGPVAYPTASLGVSAAGAGCPLRAGGQNAYDIYTLASLALFVAGASLDEVQRFHADCADVRDDLREVLRRCAARVDLDGTLARTGQPADVDALVAAIEHEHAPVLSPETLALGCGEPLAALLTKPHGLIAVIGANAARRRQAMRSLTKALAEYRPGSAVHALFEEGEAPIEAGIRNARVPREALADGLRLASRQDPDCIAVAPVTADLGELIMTLAMTGHLMLCELEGVTAVASLRAAGAPARHIAAALLGVVCIAGDAARVDEIITIDEARRAAIARGEAPL